MGKRKDQLPKGSIKPGMPMYYLQAAAELGPLYTSPIYWPVYALLSELRRANPPDEDLVNNFSEDVANICLRAVREGDVDTLREVIAGVELTLKRLQPSNRHVPYDRTFSLSVFYENTHRRNGTKSNTKGLMEFLSSRGLRVDESYARQLRRRIGTSTKTGRPKRES